MIDKLDVHTSITSTWTAWYSAARIARSINPTFLVPGHLQR